MPGYELCLRRYKSIIIPQLCVEVTSVLQIKAVSLALCVCVCVCHVLVLCPPRVRTSNRPQPVSSAGRKSGREFESL